MRERPDFDAMEAILRKALPWADEVAAEEFDFGWEFAFMFRCGDIRQAVRTMAMRVVEPAVKETRRRWMWRWPFMGSVEVEIKSAVVESLDPMELAENGALALSDWSEDRVRIWSEFIEKYKRAQ